MNGVYLRPQHRPADRCAYPVKLEYLVAPLTAGMVTSGSIREYENALS